ncbi:hypothetical protein BIW11_02446 [Tropilaelaps mercedesae]|uniref:Uncharacterized protein n=1 Tax=Tropilaelaps mercedesae TaxID=418985 RepID=A0A1V9Y304_9ACAR|nr:hypothetical protein BIW11_02446 [Tropilaelaps mercedesae]
MQYHVPGKFCPYKVLALGPCTRFIVTTASTLAAIALPGIPTLDLVVSALHSELHRYS